MTPPSRIADDVEPAVTVYAEPSPTASDACPAHPHPAAGDDLAADLSQLLATLIRLLRREAPAPVGPGSLAALSTLVRCGSMRLGDLAVREGVAPPTLTRMIAALEDSGYVVRRPDPGDRRAVQVSVTTAGADLVAMAAAARAEVFRDRLEGLPEDARLTLVAAVPALRALAAEPGVPVR